MSDLAVESTGLTTFLLLRLAAGDVAARDLLIEHSKQRFCNLARLMLSTFPAVRRWDDTDDVFQDAMLRLCGALGQVAIASSAHYYRLAALAIRRELLDLAKKYAGPEGLGANHQTDFAANGSHSGGGQDVVADTAEPADLLAWGEFHEAIAGLPDEQREIVELLWYHGLTQAEVADQLDVSDRTVKRRWQAARLQLCRSLQYEGPKT